MNTLERRIIDISYRHQLTHISSCLNCVNLIDYIYRQKKEHEPFVQGNGHASLAHYVVLEKHGMCDAEDMVNKHGTHASRDMEHGIWCSNGSLGQAETVAVGMALADKKRLVWLVTSDGACREGSTMEAFRNHHSNMNIYIVFNGLGAYSKMHEDEIPFGGFMWHHVDQRHYPQWLRGLHGHYLKLNEEQYTELMQ